MPPAAGDKKAEKSYLSSAVDSINPWAATKASESVSSPAKSPDTQAAAGAAGTTGGAGKATAAAPPPADDHSTTHLYGQSLKTYPSDCPPLRVQWFHAVDVAKRKPQLATNKSRESPASKPPAQPKKFTAFSSPDSKAVEARYQKLLETAETQAAKASGDGHPAAQAAKNALRSSLEILEGSPEQELDCRVPVNEDFLFDVDIKKRELAPAYWLGPVYEVRRGTWFYHEGSTIRPCEENLASQLEEGYLKLKPWLHPVRPRSASASKNVTPKASSDTLAKTAAAEKTSTRTQLMKEPSAAQSAQGQSYQNVQPQTYRLFGAYMNSVATFQDANTAWLSSDGMLSWVTSSMYERFAGGGYMSGLKLVRGYSEPTKVKEKEDKQTTQAPSSAPGLDERQQKLLKRRSAPPSTTSSTSEAKPEPSEEEVPPSKEARLQRQLSSLIESGGKATVESEEVMRQREEEEIQDDYNAQVGEKQGREIEHLVLVTHGIGQLLSLRMESINFVHDVNVLRKTLKAVYANSADLKALNSEFGAGPGNCRVQVLPVCWRHLLDFPRQKTKKSEQDLGDATAEENDYPSLDDITVEGVAFARSLISDLALDVLLYQSSYREEISKIVLGECNRIHRLFKNRNPDFKGKVHLVGHSLGSAILFDVLCRQRDPDLGAGPASPLRFWPGKARPGDKAGAHELEFDFDVEDLYCLGSPIGLFQMLKGRTIAARNTQQNQASQSPLASADTANDPFGRATSGTGLGGLGGESSMSALSPAVSSPKVNQLFNVFHPSDPISYRLEPLISTAMKSLKPQSLPYTKRGLFGAVTPQGLSGIGVKVGQSVSGLWSSFSAGIANNILNKSLGLTNEEVARMAAHGSNSSQPNVASATDADTSTGVLTNEMSEKTNERKRQLANSSTSGSHVSASGNDPTLIDDELETLYSRFNKRSDDTKTPGPSDKPQEDERKARKLRAEESKVRALNRNGRVDFSIQESALDFNPVNTIASHMCYWADEDVNHFVLSQLLSNKSNGAKIQKSGTDKASKSQGAS